MSVWKKVHAMNWLFTYRRDLVVQCLLCFFFIIFFIVFFFLGGGGRGVALYSLVLYIIFTLMLKD